MVAIPMLWPRRPIEERVGTPGSRTVNDFSRFARMRSLILCLDMETHFALRQCGRGACLAAGFPQPLARDDQVYYWTTRFLHVDGPHAVELQRLGVSRGCLARTMACAWDWMDALKGQPVFHTLWRDPFLGAIVIVRIVVKFEITEKQQAPALRLYRCARNHTTVETLETEVVQVLPGRQLPPRSKH